ncbi:MAG: hypothetical protein ACI4F4_00900, partial [Lachnospiraceae bacterium]
YEAKEEPEMMESYEAKEESEVMGSYEAEEEPEEFSDEHNYSEVDDSQVIGEQLTFKMETSFEQEINERKKLRYRIIISETMEKKLLALKETK